MLRDHLAVAELLKNLIKGNTDHISRVTYRPEKTAVGGEESEHLERCTPESQGVSSRHLAAFFEELAEDERTDLHHVIVLRHGKVIAQADRAPYRRDVWHTSYSMCKSITGMAIGMLIAEGKLSLEDKIYPILDKKLLFTGGHQKSLTVEHLLTMTTGVTFNETGIVSGDDWVTSYLLASTKGKPGKTFEYNSMNTYILSAIVTKITGEPMVEYLRPRLWEPLGIHQVYWETCPMGINKGGWGLFLTTEDAAKLGQLYLRKGNWEGQQLLPECWVEAATSHQEDTPENMGPYGYGYQVWLGGRPGSFTFNGMLGQNVVGYPDLDLVIATNAGSDELFQNCVLLDIVRRYFEVDFEPEEILPEDPAALRKLRDTESVLERFGTTKKKLLKRTDRAKIHSWRRKGSAGEPEFLFRERFMKALNGKRYQLNEKHVGLCPLVFQVFHNNYTDGIGSAGFAYEDGRFFLLLEEGEHMHRIEVGFSRAAETVCLFHEEPYLLGVKGEITCDEDGSPVLKLNLAFLEEAVRRTVKCCFRNGYQDLEMRWDETPGSRMITEGLDSLLQDTLKTGLMDTLQNKIGVDLPAILVDRTIHPVVTGHLEETVRLF